ncbi:winged helix-turn-helix domain-containing protein [Vibrio harveyi]|uniref:OmpR/PhoB-type domain-containing protein n=1 Tax=Vibrio harveyi TaxID=669 RepID=A0ABM5XT39_VIBHA|nr:winged helix-turn-helix domain-containing protein [Vibrio harveyi]AMF96263.1 hypothetical protein AL538_00245 [Vibrio harveyi]QFQ77528.1 hypothetical protein F9277_08985 [Vibrio harveyi]HBH7876281.1 winged helix-turn-helix domain-containing protein [Vibrio parahaemolyticus]
MKMYYSLGKDINFCYQRREIQAKSKVIKLGGRESNILLLLLDNPNVILSKDFINKRVWGDILVADTSLTKAIYNIRKAFSNCADISCELKTFSKQGYILVMEKKLEEVCDSELKSSCSLLGIYSDKKLIYTNKKHHKNTFYTPCFLQTIVVAFSTSIITVTTELIVSKLHLF